MDNQSSEPLCGVGSTVTHSTPMSECKQGCAEGTTFYSLKQTNNHDNQTNQSTTNHKECTLPFSCSATDRSALLDHMSRSADTTLVLSKAVQTMMNPRVGADEETVIMAERKNDVPENSWRSNSSEPDWITTTDTSIHSSLSTTRSVEALDVPIEVLEACDGMDDANLYPTSEVRLGKGKVIGRTVARNSRKVERKESSASGSSSSGDSGSASSSYDTASSSSSTSSSSCRHTLSCSCSSRSTGSDSSSSCSHSSSCSCSHASSCSCSHASSCSDLSSSCSDHSSTSFQSEDDLTELPRAKTRSRRLGKMACKKVADKCNQS